MVRAFAVAAVVALLCLGSSAQADVFNVGPGLTNLETVPVGDLGNLADTRYSTQGYGAVGYGYRIGKYEVTSAQYCDFLNHKAKSDPYALYDIRMSYPTNRGYEDIWGCNIQRDSGSGTETDPYVYSVAADWANRPVNYVSYWDACRFANWLHNGQRDGDTETGAYTLDGYNGMLGGSIQRNTGAKWAVTSEDEWYKAAYYKSGGTNAGYWDYPTQSVVEPGNQVLDPDPGNSANFCADYQAIPSYTLGSPYWRTEVGEFENSGSAYGAFDQGGNVWEWNEAIWYQAEDMISRGQRGGSFAYDYSDLLPLYRNWGSLAPTDSAYQLGFRVAYIPEPSSFLAVAVGLVSLLCARRRMG